MVRKLYYRLTNLIKNSNFQILYQFFLVSLIFNEAMCGNILFMALDPGMSHANTFIPIIKEVSSIW
jgi:hypothetical protein